MLWLIPLAAASSPCPSALSELASPLVAPDDPRVTSLAPLVVVRKQARTLMVFRGGRRVEEACWPIALGIGARSGPKLREGDLKTPEGWYRLSDKPWSSFYAALYVHYPNAVDAERGEANELITAEERQKIDGAVEEERLPPQGTALGGEILIHGGGTGSDWTLGCIALQNADIDALRALLPPEKKAWVVALP